MVEYIDFGGVLNLKHYVGDLFKKVMDVVNESGKRTLIRKGPRVGKLCRDKKEFTLLGNDTLLV